MVSADARPVSVIIAAYQASGTIARAVSSALSDPLVGEVIVVDDCSHDATVATATAAGQGDPRLSVLRQRENRGPAAARNAAIDAGRAPLIAILDSDDFLLPDRFASMIAESEWDLVADNIVFLDPHHAFEPAVGAARASARTLDLASFVAANISRRGRERGEVGFLKPVMRRAFLARHGLRYDESLRLGEDYVLYARALAAGARYKVVGTCGYAAVERPDSLSGSHRTEDLRRLHAADRAMLAECRLGSAERRALERHARHVRARYVHRRFLDTRRERGALAALGDLLAEPARVPDVVSGIFADKTAHLWAPAPRETGPAAGEGVRYLFPVTAGQE